jgi:hypothetical protein
VSVRDASYLYEIEIRDGSPRKATRTASDGGYQSGERSLASLLGVGAGRFVVSPSRGPIRGELTGTLFEQLARPIAAARGALAVTTGARTVLVERITIDEEALEEYLRATPDPARALIKRLARGDSPRQMLLTGEVPPSLFEDVVTDLAARGAIRGVRGVGGQDVLTQAVETALAVLRGAPKRTQTLPPNARASVLPPPVVIPAGTQQTKAAQPVAAPLPETVRPGRAQAPRPQPAKYESLKLSDPPPPAPPPPAPSSAPVLEEQPVPSSLEDAVMREISDRSPMPPGAARTSTSNPPPIIEPSELKMRSSNPPAVATPEEEEGPLPSIPPDAVVPGATSSEETAAAPVSSSAPDLRAARSDEPVHDTAVDAPVVETKTKPSPPLERTLPLPTAASAPKATPPPLPAPARAPARAPTPAPAPARAPTPAPHPAKAPAAAAPPLRRIPWGGVLSFLVLGFAAGAVIDATHPDVPATQPSALAISAAGSPIPEKPTASAAQMPTAAPSGSVVATALPSASASAAPSASSSITEDIPPGAEVPAGYGLVEVHAPQGSRLRIDGAVVANGPSASLVAAPGFHEVRAERDGRTTKHVVEVRAGKVTRVDFPVQ